MSHQQRPIARNEHDSSAQTVHQAMTDDEWDDGLRRAFADDPVGQEGNVERLAVVALLIAFWGCVALMVRGCT